MPGSQLATEHDCVFPSDPFTFLSTKPKIPDDEKFAVDKLFATSIKICQIHNFKTVQSGGL